jgi:hypothetical protein
MTVPTLLRRRATAKAYVAAERAKTVCAECGRQPIEFHREEHHDFPNNRVAGLAARGQSIERIAREIAASTPLCRRCHMKHDGRLAALSLVRPFKKGDKQPPKPCAACGTPANPLRKGLCNRCNHRKRLGKL